MLSWLNGGDRRRDYMAAPSNWAPPSDIRSIVEKSGNTCADSAKEIRKVLRLRTALRKDEEYVADFIGVSKQAVQEIESCARDLVATAPRQRMFNMASNPNSKKGQYRGLQLPQARSPAGRQAADRMVARIYSVSPALDPLLMRVVEELLMHQRYRDGWLLVSSSSALQSIRLAAERLFHNEARLKFKLILPKDGKGNINAARAYWRQFLTDGESLSRQTMRRSIGTAGPHGTLGVQYVDLAGESAMPVVSDVLHVLLFMNRLASRACAKGSADLHQ